MAVDKVVPLGDSLGSHWTFTSDRNIHFTLTPKIYPQRTFYNGLEAKIERITVESMEKGIGKDLETKLRW